MRALVNATFLVAIGLSSCLSPEVASRWPTPDLRIEVLTADQTSTGLIPRQVLYVFHDGIVVYAESDESIERKSVDTTSAVSLPVFATVSVYQVQPESLRSLCRSFERSGLFSSQARNQPTRNGRARHISIAWRADGGADTITGTVGGSGVVDRAVRILDGMLPEGRTLGDGRGRAAKRALDEVPQPRRAPADAHAIFATLGDKHVGLWTTHFHRFCLALALDRKSDARSALEAMRAAIAVAPSGITGIGTSTQALDRLESLL